VFLNTLGLDSAKQTFGKGGKVCLQLENPSMSLDQLTEALIAVVPAAIATSNTTDGIKVGDV
jgi:hypothetical protein